MYEDSVEERGGDELLQHLASVARDLAEADSVDETLQRLVDRAEEFLENCNGASLMLIRSSREIITPAFSSEVAHRSDMAQYETDEGPCLGAIREQHTVVIDDLEHDDRWPDYAARARELGVGSMISFRMFMAEDTMGALNLYSEQPHAFDERSRIIGDVFAAHGAVAMKAAISETSSQEAIASRDIVGQAKGILMERERISAAQAFDRLRELSQRRNRKLRDIAQDIATTGVIPDGG